MLKGGIREWRERGFATAKADTSAEATGPALYKQHCITCHGGEGQGVPPHFPPLAKDPMMTSADPWPAIYVTLEGLIGRPLAGKTYTGAMGPFKNILTDAEIAALLTHARGKFGGVKVPVTAADVRRVRRDISRDKFKPTKPGAT